MYIRMRILVLIKASTDLAVFHGASNSEAAEFTVGTLSEDRTMSYLRVSKVKYGLAAILCVIEIAHRRRSARQRLAWHLTAMLIVGLSVSVSPVLAQVTTGDILGTVADQTGAIVPNASVTAVNEANGTTRMTQTGTNGEFTFNLLDPGMYTITVKVAGFKETQVTHVELSLGARARVDAVLQAGQVSESVTVEGNQRAALQN